MPGSVDHIIYNDFDGHKNIGVINNIYTDELSLIDMPIANVSPKGDFALSYNFSRLYDYRPGYGYLNIVDKHISEIAPQDDGVFLIDLKNNKSKLYFNFN